MVRIDPLDDIYRMFDEVGLSGTKLLVTREPMVKMVNTMRSELAQKLKLYIEQREQEQTNGE